MCDKIPLREWFMVISFFCQPILLLIALWAEENSRLEDISFKIMLALVAINIIILFMYY